MDMCQTSKVVSVFYNVAMAAKLHFKEGVIKKIFLKDYVIEPMLELRLCEKKKIAEMADAFLHEIGFVENFQRL